MDLLTKLSTLSTKIEVDLVDKSDDFFENTFRAKCRKKTSLKKELTNEMSKKVEKIY